MDLIPLFILIVLGVVIITLVILFILKKLKGKMNILLDKYSFAPGEEITGSVQLTLKRDVPAKELKVGLIGVKKSTNISRVGGNTSREQNVQTIYDFYIPLDGEKTYLAGDRNYNFRLAIPNDIISRNKIENPLIDGIVKSIGILSGNLSNQIEWFVVGNLSVTGFDLNKKVKINIS